MTIPRFCKPLLCLSGAFWMARAFQDTQATPQTTQASTVTMILTNSFKTIDVPPPSNTSFVIYPNDAGDKESSDGLYLLYSGPMQSLLNELVVSHCSDIQNSACMYSINSAYDDSHDRETLNRRVVPFFNIPFPKGFGLLTVFVIAVSYMTAQFRDVPPQLHLDPLALQSIKSASNASALVLAKKPDDPKAVLVALNTTQIYATPFPPPTFSDGGDTITKNGTNAILTVSDKVIVEQFYSTMDTCPNIPPGLNKRQLSDCLLRLAQNLILALGPDDPLNQLLGVAFAMKTLSPPKKFAPPEYDETLISFANWTGMELAQILPGQEVLPDQVLGTVTFAWTLGMAKQMKIPFVGQSLTLPALYTDNDWEAICPDKSRLLCSNPVCQGQDGRCTTALMSTAEEGCECETCEYDEENNLISCDNCNGESTGYCVNPCPALRCVLDLDMTALAWDQALFDIQSSVLARQRTMQPSSSPAPAAPGPPGPRKILYVSNENKSSEQ